MLASGVLVATGVLMLIGCDQAKEGEQSPAAAAPSQSASAASPKSASEARPPGELLEAGERAPQIDVIAHTGQRVSLEAFRGQPVVVYFYPEDGTPGCTKQAKELRNNWLHLRKTGMMVLGVSADDNVSHRAFASEHELPFLLLPDPDHTIARKFGVPINDGRAARVTFVIDRQGQIAQVIEDVTPEGSAQQVLEAVQALDS